MTRKKTENVTKRKKKDKRTIQKENSIGRNKTEQTRDTSRLKKNKPLQAELKSTRMTGMK